MEQRTTHDTNGRTSRAKAKNGKVAGAKMPLAFGKAFALTPNKKPRRIGLVKQSTS